MFRFNSKKMIMVLSTAVVLSLLPAACDEAWGSEENAGMTGDWLTHFRSARSMGLGGAFTAIADEPIGMVWNPAGLTQLYRNEVYLETARLFEGTSITSFSFAVPGTRFPTLGLSILSLSSGTFEKTNEFNEVTGSFNESNMAFILSASHDLYQFLSVGGNLKVLRQSMDEFNDTGIGIDLGIMARVMPGLSLGASLLNIGGPSLSLRDTDESYPVEFRGGFALQILSGRAAVTGEIVRISGIETSFHAGTEYWVNQSLGLRLGLNALSPAGGFCFRLPRDVRLDYGMENHELGVTHRFSVNYAFGGFFAKSKAEPSVFSPLGSRSVTKFHLSSRTRKDVSRWELSVIDKFDKKVRMFGGRGTPPAHIMWDGKAGTGTPVPDGIYTYRLTIIDAGGMTISGRPGTVEIDTSIPQVKVPVVVGRRDAGDVDGDEGIEGSEQ
ncbi:MAG: PorV/PorQ family protein [Bacteroidales bacterium]|nr:PorV/PorQ family protein [Candidatus Latescibacterota bacterium]